MYTRKYTTFLRTYYILLYYTVVHSWYIPGAAAVTVKNYVRQRLADLRVY